MLPFLFSAMTMKRGGPRGQRDDRGGPRQFREIDGIMEGTGEPDAARCVAISTRGALKQMIVPGLLAVVAPDRRRHHASWARKASAACWPASLLGRHDGDLHGQRRRRLGQRQNGAELGGKGSDAHKAAVVGDTVGDPFKDTSGPSLNILVKLMTVVGLVFLPWFV